MGGAHYPWKRPRTACNRGVYRPLMPARGPAGNVKALGNCLTCQAARTPAACCRPARSDRLSLAVRLSESLLRSSAKGSTVHRETGGRAPAVIFRNGVG